ncbi:MAG TPA: esterase-like activity of phytase family protein [Candidatus Eisenbacteria bacterium]|nr:esterase-like activity of phytase family protein [Candidatus Eisenbacteria bacterium]
MTALGPERPRGWSRPSPPSARRVRSLLLLLALGLCGCAASRSGNEASAGIELIPVGRYDFEAQPTGDPALLAEELSGIVWIGGEQYLTVGDDHASVHQLTIHLDPVTGRVVDAQFRTPVRLADPSGTVIPDSLGSDREGIAFIPQTHEVWISNEHTEGDQSRSSLARHRLRDGRMLELVRTDGTSMLRIFSRQRLNGGFEALARTADGSTYWVANEMPLSIDGEPATDSTGGIVRLQRLDGQMRPLRQYAYDLDPYLAKIQSPPQLAGFAVSGLSELLVLEGEKLLGLERSFAGDSTGNANLRVRLYEIDLRGATDVGVLGWAEGLKGRSYRTVTKRLLWQENFGLTTSNFEGMTLGPTLENGDRSLILIADNNGGRSEALYVLRVRGLRS